MRARTAILTGPPPAILSIDFDPPLDGANAQWLQRMPMGTSLKLAACPVWKVGACADLSVILFWREPYLRNLQDKPKGKNSLF